MSSLEARNSVGPICVDSFLVAPYVNLQDRVILWQASVPRESWRMNSACPVLVFQSVVL